MNTQQRLLKRQKRKVARAKENITVSEPDVRTPEQIEAARQASRPAGGHAAGGQQFSATSFRGGKASGTGSAAKTDA